MVGLLVNQSAARVLFTLAIAPGAESIPLHDSDGSVVVISYNDHLQYVPAVYWTATTLLSTGEDGILEQNGLFMLEVRLDESGIDPLPRAYTTFNLEIKSPTGVILDLRRTIPPTTASVVVLY